MKGITQMSMIINLELARVGKTDPQTSIVLKKSKHFKVVFNVTGDKVGYLSPNSRFVYI